MAGGTRQLLRVWVVLAAVALAATLVHLGLNNLTV